MGKQTPEYKKKHPEQNTVLGMRGKAEPAASMQKVWGATLTLEMKNYFKLNKQKNTSTTLWNVNLEFKFVDLGFEFVQYFRNKVTLFHLRLQ